MRSDERNGIHPTLSRDTPEFMEWWEYYDRHLGKVPITFQMFIDGQSKGYTVPEDRPEWFDPSFHPMPGWKPRERRPVRPPADKRVSWANVLVRKDHPRFAEMVARAQWDDIREFTECPEGIWVAVNWINGGRPNG